MKAIYLHGSLGKKFGSRFDLAVADAPGAVRFLSAQLPGFRQALSKGEYRVIRGKVYKNGKPRPGAMALDESDIHMPLKDELHIFPVMKGAKEGGIGKIIIGIALVAIAFALPGGFLIGSLASGTLSLTAAGTLALFGTALALSGVAMMLAPTPESNYEDREAEDQSFLFNGSVNTTEQGGPVPLVYGTFLTGSKVVSASLVVEDIAIGPSRSPDGNYGGSDSDGPNGGFDALVGYWVGLVT